MTKITYIKNTRSSGAYVKSSGSKKLSATFQHDYFNLNNIRLKNYLFIIKRVHTNVGNGWQRRDMTDFEREQEYCFG
jgi:hypothetical protein